ncbi:MAG: haloacid dehalogenase-like hydrolase [Lachnospiraceae bacterium]|nr:haloacid dehalogenase-like hydrolase [Ruminococcus sp.]MCM1276847.1 haloacid dehalogenase-like hydrolase [Lachnospiraceae bacterium]
MSKTFNRKTKEERPVLAICYDFDKTLTPDDMQAQGFIQSVGYDIADFWHESNGLAENNDMDQNLAYMYKMFTESEGKILFTKKILEDYGAKISLFNGVDDWFERIRRYGEEHNVIVEHYIISSGLKEMIEGTSAAKQGAFEKIYASSFFYNERGVAVWPAQVVNYTNKTQFLFRIEKGVLDINDPGVNDYFKPDDIRVPFRNMIYIGDSDTDIPCMKLVNTYGGHSIGVYNANQKEKAKAKVFKMMGDNRIKYFAPADYSDGSELDSLVKAIIDRTDSNERLEGLHYSCFDEYSKKCKENSEAEQRKNDIIARLQSSGSFESTHSIIQDLLTERSWTQEQADWLFDIAISNNQVRWILGDRDVKVFYSNLLKKTKELSDSAKIVQDELANK